MAVKAVHVADVPHPNLDHQLIASDNAINRNEEERNLGSCGYKFPKFVVMGHRGSGMNMLQSSDSRMKSIKENTLLSFNSAAKLPLDFIEFDVQVTKDDCPVIFHDNFIFTQTQGGSIVEQRLTDLTLSEFLSYGPQIDGTSGKPLFRKTKDGRIFEWEVEQDDCFCTLEQALTKVDSSIGFNVELKFDDHLVYTKHQLTHVLNSILKVVHEHVKDRPLMFSSFHPDAAMLMRKLQDQYPVFFLTNGGSENYTDVRRNSLDEAIKVCKEGGLQGIVSEVKAVFRNPGAVSRIKDSNLCLVTYGQLNNVGEVVYMQHLMGVEGVIVDLVGEITEAVAEDDDPDKRADQIRMFQLKTEAPQFSRDELSFLLNLIPQLMLALRFLLIGALLCLTSGRPIPSPSFDSMYYFGNGDPATSDGLLMVDYMASAFNLPSPNLDFRQQRTFDYDVSAAMDDTFYLRNQMPQVRIIRNRSLHSQFDSFSDSLDSLCSSPQDCKNRLRKSVFVLDQIGSSDYQYSFLNGKSIRETYSYIDSVVFTIQYIVQKLIEKGATELILTGTLPMGCLPGYLTLFRNQTHEPSSFDRHGCLASMNTFSIIHNDRLKLAISDLREKHQDVEIEFADTYRSFMEVLENHELLGFNEDTLLKACCGNGGEYSYDPEKVCGKQGIPVCLNPWSYLSWDGFHLTQEAMKLVVEAMLGGKWAFVSAHKWFDVFLRVAWYCSLVSIVWVVISWKRVDLELGRIFWRSCV
ncbi:Glycerophosphodiester phosphodiesterase GDPD3 [Linum perenne]